MATNDDLEAHLVTIDTILKQILSRLESMEKRLKRIVRQMPR